MDQLIAALNGAWQVLIAGLFLGAGLPALFAAGVRIRATGRGAYGNKSRTAGVWISSIIFAVVILCVIFAIVVIGADGMGYKVAFDGITPYFAKKH